MGRKLQRAPKVSSTPTPNDVSWLLQQGVGYHQSGNLALAAECYDQVLSRLPGQADALHLRGVVYHQNGDHTRAVDLIGRSVKTKPNNAEAQSNLGAAMTASGDLDGARCAFQQAVRLNPCFLDAQANLAALSVRQGRDADAIKGFQRAHELKPDEGRFMKRLADLYLKTGQFADAVDWYERFLAQSGSDLEAHNNTGFACERLERFDDAERHYRKAVALEPGKPELANNLATLLARLGRRDEAASFIARAVNAPAETWEDPANLARALMNQGRVDEALGHLRRIVSQRPDDGMLQRDFGLALLRSGDIDGAKSAFGEAVRLDASLDDARVELARCHLAAGNFIDALEQFGAIPETSPHYLDAALDRAMVLAEMGSLEEACLAARQAVAHPDFKSTMFVKPLSVFRAACAFDDMALLDGSLDGIEDRDLSTWAATFLELLTWADSTEKTDALVTLHRRWGDQLIERVSAGRLDEPEVVGGRGAIRIGFVSSDLRKHSVARFVLPLFENYDRDALEIYCYASREEEGDEIQQRMRGMVQEFRFVGDQSHTELAQTIRDDRIDILIELNGFTAESRLMVMAFRPAPVQINWLGYPFTCGLRAVDYILLDEGAVPESPDWLVETPLIMPDSYLCYDPIEATMPADDSPVARNGFVTFGTLNNPYKFTRDAIALWADVMKRTPGSRYLFAHMAYDAPLLIKNIVAEFARHGVDNERLTFVSNRPKGVSHFPLYDEIDLTLDTFPLTGGTTSCDALWMGVPIVTLVGPATHQRLTYTMLRSLGLDELCAFSADVFSDIAVRLAGDHERLHAFRHELRPMMKTSTLGNPERFGRDFSNLVKDVAARHRLR